MSDNELFTELDPVTEREKTMSETRSVLESKIDEALTEEAIAKATKKVRDALDDLASDFESTIKQWVPYNLAAWVQDMAERAIESMLRGDEATMRNYLKCAEGGWNGRAHEASVIHGKLFETGAIELRRDIVNAHAELLKDERILDLEAQVKSLVDQVRKAEARLEESYQRQRSTEF